MSIPAIRLRAIYPMSNCRSWLCSIFKLSRPSVEKVLNPPQKPTARSSLVEGRKAVFASNPYSTPRSRQAAILAAKVAKGNVPGAVGIH